MNNEVSKLVSELGKISADAQETFDNLSAVQINWKPSADGWSVGQCFEHLMKANLLFFPELEKIAGERRKNSFLENYSPLSSFFGNLLVKSLQKDERKFKAPSQAIVPPSEIDAHITELFAAHQSELIERVKSTEKADWQKTKITSPFMKLITYTLADGYRVVVEHERRHIRQAKRVMQTENFPTN
ncbi:MAG: DinB family protein [Acidobacteriota bacterium]|nr:DinB family protein [Acidobacteriota bacterium]